MRSRTLKRWRRKRGWGSKPGEYRGGGKKRSGRPALRRCGIGLPDWVWAEITQAGVAHGVSPASTLRYLIMSHLTDLNAAAHAVPRIGDAFTHPGRPSNRRELAMQELEASARAEAAYRAEMAEKIPLDAEEKTG